MTAFATRIVFFSPDPTLDWWIPVAAIVRIGLAQTHAVDAELLPCDDLPSQRSRELLEHGLDVLRVDALSFRELPSSMGPHFRLGPPCTHPSVPDPVAWTREHLLPSRKEAASG